MMKCKILLVLLTMLVVFSCKQTPMAYDEAVDKLAALDQRVNWGENYTVRVSSLPDNQMISISDTLPDINTYDMVVEPTGRTDVEVEIFTSTEKSGSGTDGWMTEVAQAFNASNPRLKNGKSAGVFIRKIASGTGYEYIASKKYIPDAFTPSNHLWINMTAAAGIKMTPVSEQLVLNTAGIVMKDETYSMVEKEYGKVDLSTILNAVIQGKLFMGYTNPYASSTGLNFLAALLATFVGGDNSKLLSPEAVSSFEEFQKGVPFVSLTTLQMRSSVEKGGSLDAFVMEYQTFVNTQALQSGYKFIPFGITHDNPLYGVGEISPEKKEALELFAAFAGQSKNQKLAKKYGFNDELNHTYPYEVPDGLTLIRAQQLWKEGKDSGQPIIAVFLSDISGSMRGSRMKLLQEALETGSKFIDDKNYIGMVSFESSVTKLLPIEQFNPMHQAKFLAAVHGMEAGGSTAMFDGIVVSLQMIVQKKQEIPNGKPILFVLTDGETNTGFSYSKVKPVLEGLKIPIYTISYGEDVSILKELSLINEAATLKANEEDIAYQIGNLLNAEM